MKNIRIGRVFWKKVIIFVENKRVMTFEKLDFALFCIGCLSERLNLNQTVVYDKLQQSGILQNYIVKGYDVLHTFDSEYITDEIIDYMNEKGVL